MMRCIADPTQYEHLRNLQPLQKFICLSAFGLGAAFLLFVVNFSYGVFRSERAPAASHHAGADPAFTDDIARQLLQDSTGSS